MGHDIPDLEPTAEVGILGLGPMGAPIAERLVASGIPTVAWNRTLAKASRLAKQGAIVAARPADAARPVVLTVLPDLPEVESVLNGPDGLIAGWRTQHIEAPTLVVHGTVSPIAVQKFATQLHDNFGVTVIDAPLSGGTIGARNGTLSVMGGGERVVFESLEPIFRHYATTITYMGASGTGGMTKVCNQIVVASTVAAISEAVLLARSTGIDVADLFSVLAGGLANSEVIAQKSDKWIRQDYSEGGSGKNQLKDLRFAQEVALQHRLALPVVETIQSMFARMVADGEGHFDHTGVYRTIARLAMPNADTAPDTI